MNIPKLAEAQVAALCPEFLDIREIDAGGFKTVYRARHEGRDEVIKVIGIPQPDGREFMERFREECIGRVAREVEILNRCQSPFLVRTGALSLFTKTVDGQDYVLYSEEYLPGRDLWTILRAGGERPSEGEAKQLMRCLLLAIQELWGMRVIHRDIKPKNVMKLNDPNRPFVLLDLGIAFSLVETGLTYNAAMRDPPATFRYLAPEMGDPHFRANLDYRADLYTTALTVYEYASGHHPIARDSDDPVRTVTRALRQLPDSLAKHRPDFSKRFVRLIDQLLKKRPALRPANLDHLIRETGD